MVYVLNVSDGCIPSDMATGRPEQIEEERRLLYVAMTRARDHLYLVQPHRFYRHQQNRHGDSHVYGARTRFIPSSILDRFERSAPRRSPTEGALRGDPHRVRVDIGARLRETWS